MTIDGVRVLAQETINKTPDWVVTMLVVLFSCMIVTAIMAIILLKDWIVIGFEVISIITVAWIIIAGAIGVFNEPSGRNTYKCIFDEDISIQEIYDKYEVIGQDGEIWILEDKE